MATSAGTQSFKDFEREGWHRQAPNYDDRAGRMTTEAVAPLLDAVGARSGMRLLDVCCGPGYVAAEAAARGLSAVGVDIAPAMVDVARGRVPGAEFRVGDAEALEFGDGAFDAVACAFGLLHLPQPDRAMAEAFRVLRPGGGYAFTVWDGPERGVFLGLGLQALTTHADMSVPLPPAPPIFQMADRALTAAALARAGFRDVAIREIPIAFRGERPEDAWDWFEKSTVRTMMMFGQQTPEVQARIKAAVIEGARRHAGPEGVIVPSPALLFAAWRPVGGP
jgi:ubiquinone/menaquinone biosynthesis C-methylase UbiE